jgi:hypothetical protein
MICPHCGRTTGTQYFKDGVGQCTECTRVIEYQENKIPNKVDLNEIEQDATNQNENKKNIELPGYDRSMSVFSEEIAEELKDKNLMFFRVDTKEIIEVGTIETETEKGKKLITGFLTMKPNRFITTAEKHINFIKQVENKKIKQIEPKIKSVSCETANIVLASEILQKKLPQITRIFTTPIPIMYKGELTFPIKGYDPRFKSWLPYDAPEITEPNMSLKEAKELIATIYQEFCFKTQQDYYKAISALLTPFLRGLYTNFNDRTPIYIYMANRPGAGKDYLAGVRAYLYEGVFIEETALCNDDKFSGNNSEELGKKILSAFISGRKSLHFSNNKGHLNNTELEGLATKSIFSNRLLGRNETLTFENELELSLSGNTGLTYAPDIARRSIVINLSLEIENPNDRKFKQGNLHGYILENRGKILSALYSLVRNWKEQGSPKGTLEFTSYPQWGSLCGGIMELAGYGNPCKIDPLDYVSLDTEGDDIKELVNCSYKAYSSIENNNKPLKKKDIIEIATANELFNDLNLAEDKPGDMRKFSDILKKYNEVKFSFKLDENSLKEDFIKMRIINPNVKFSRMEFKFIKNEETKTLIDFGVGLNAKTE